MPAADDPTIIGSTTVSANKVAIAASMALPRRKHLRASGRGKRMIADHHAAAARCRLLLTIENCSRAIPPVTGHGSVILTARLIVREGEPSSNRWRLDLPYQCGVPDAPPEPVIALA